MNYNILTNNISKFKINPNNNKDDPNNNKEQVYYTNCMLIFHQGILKTIIIKNKFYYINKK